jgi:hypothetical protein
MFLDVLLAHYGSHHTDLAGLTQHSYCAATNDDATTITVITSK